MEEYLKIMIEETEKIGNEINKDLDRTTSNHPYGIPPIMSMKPEKIRDYENMSEEQRWRELA